MPDAIATTPAPPATYSCCPPRRLFGPLLLIGLGVVFLLERFHLFGAHQLIVPVVFIVLGLANLAEPRSRHHQMWGFLWLGLGSLMALGSLGYAGYNFERLWPLLLIAAGISMLVQGPWRRRL